MADDTVIMAGKGKKRANQEGTIVPLANGKWRVQLSLGYKEDGTRNRPSRVFSSHAEAITWKNSMLAQAGEYGIESVKQNNGLFVPKFMQWLNEEFRQKVKSPQYYTATRNFNNYIKPFFQKKKQTDLTRDDFKKFFVFLENRNVGMETRRKIKGILYQYFENEYANSPMRNPLDKIPIATKKEEETIINPEEFFSDEDYKAIPVEYRQEFLDALDNEKQNPFFKPLCYLMYYSGIRIGEALALQWKDFDFERRYFLVYKAVSREYEIDEYGHKIGNSRNIVKSTKSAAGIRPLALLDVEYEALMEWKEYRAAQERVKGIPFTDSESYIFANDDGELRSEWGTNSMFQRFRKRHNLEGKGIHFHALRQTLSNTLFEMMKDDEESIIKTMGHTKISTTKKNYHTVGKFDSVQKVARTFNEMYPPRDERYKASESVTFAPDGYLSEEQGVERNAPATPVQEPQSKPIEKEKTLQELLQELAMHPEFAEILKAASKSEME